MSMFAKFLDPQLLAQAGLQLPSDTLLSLAAQHRPAPAAAPPPAPLSIPPAQPPIFLPPPPPQAALPIPPAQPPIFPSAPNPPATPSARSTGAAEGIGQGVNSAFTNHALTLMALGAGIAQGGIGKGLALAATAAESERNRQAQQLNFLQTYKALTDGGVPPEEARAAISNPNLMRTVAAKYLGLKAHQNVPSGSRLLPSNPDRPAGVPDGSTYSQPAWKAPDGTMFDDQGKPMT